MNNDILFKYYDIVDEYLMEIVELVSELEYDVLVYYF